MTRTDARDASRLRALRRARGWTQADLAARAGCSKTHVWNVETRAHRPSWPLVQALARALAVSPSDLLEDFGWVPLARRGSPFSPRRVATAAWRASIRWDQAPALLAVPDVADLFRVSDSAAFQWFREPGFPSIPGESRRVVPRDALRVWWERQVLPAEEACNDRRRT